jgi:hypothetical protein
MRDALFGNPPTPATKPSREGVFAAFTSLAQSLTILAGGAIGSGAPAVYAALTTLNNHLEFPDRALGLVYNDGTNSGIYIKNGAAGSGSWIATGLLGTGLNGQNATIAIGTVTQGNTPAVANSGTSTAAVLDFVLQKGDTGKSFLQTAIDTGYVPAGTTEAQLNDKIVGQITATAVTARDAAVVARTGSEAARDTSRGWAEGPVPDGGGRSSKGWAQVAQAGAAVADTARAAVEQAISQVPTDTRLLLEAVTISVLASVAADTPVGRLAYLAEPGREGVWQLRAGDYTSQIAADAFGFRYLKVTAVSASQKAWVRIIPDGVFQAAWTGFTSDTPDVVAHLRSAAKLLDPYAVLQLPAFRMPVNGNGDPRIVLKVTGTNLRGQGDASWIDYTGTNAVYPIVQVASDDVRVSSFRISGIAPNNSAGNPANIMVSALEVYSEPTQIKNTAISGMTLDRTSLGIIAFANYNVGASQFFPPQGVKIQNIECDTNGVAVSIFGADDVSVSDYDFTFNTSNPSPNAKACAIRALGSERGEVNQGTISGFPVGILLDASYFGASRHPRPNRDFNIGPVNMINVGLDGIQIIECAGECKISRPTMRRSLASVDDHSNAVRILGSLDLGTVPPDNPSKSSIVGSIVIDALDAEGFAMGLFHQGATGTLVVGGSRLVANNTDSNQPDRRGAVYISGIAGRPSSIHIDNSDFMMTAVVGSGSMLLQANGQIEVNNCLLPERADPENSITVLRGNVIATDAVQQRPFNNRADLGSNRCHPIGALANYRNGTPLPAPTFTAAPWTRSLVNVTESPTGTFTKSGGVDGTFDATVLSTERYVGDFELVYRVKQKTPQMVVGVASADRGPSFAAPDYCLFYTADSTIYTVSGAQLRNTQDYDATTIERWSRRGTRLTLTRNNVLVVDVTVSAELALGLQACLRTVGDAVEVLRFAPL